MKSINNIKYLATFLIFIGSSSMVQAQECLDQLKQLYKTMEEDMTRNEGNVFHLKYQMTNVLGADKGGQSMSTKVEILSQGNKSYYISDQASIFQDAQLTYTVMPSEKEIIITPNKGESIKQARLNQITAMQERILTVAKLKSCNTVSKNGKNLQQIVVVLPLEDQKSTKIQEISFLVDLGSASLFESTITYVQEGDLVSSKMIYETIDYNSATNRLQKPVAGEVFISGQEPISQFKGYKVINYANQ